MKADCLVVLLDYCRGHLQVNHREVLRRARIAARKLVLVSRCGEVARAMEDVRKIAADNMDLPMRFYMEVGPEEVVALEGCSTYQVKAVEELTAAEIKSPA